VSDRTSSRRERGSTGSRSRPSKRRRRSGLGLWGWLLSGFMLLTLAMIGSGWWLYHELGRSPGELLDYVEHRLEGHTRLEALTEAPIAYLRDAFDASRAADRLNTPFPVPPPPPRRGAGEVLAAEPVPPGAKVWRVGRSSGALLRISDAASQAQDGDVVEIEAGDYRGDVAVWEQKRLTIRGIDGAARIFADGRSAEGKAIWVIRNGQFDIANIDFIGAKVDDSNGAGIRFEGGQLRLRHCLFWGNEMGLLTGGEGTAIDATLVIENSEFAYSHVSGRWGHNIYVGRISEFSISGSYSHHAGRGHLLKSRARVNQVLYNRLTDEAGGRASYELDFPNGGLVRVVGNVLQQQPETDNSTLIAYGEEGYAWPENRLSVASNTLVNDLHYGGTYIWAASGATSVTSSNNLLVGPGGYRAGKVLSVWNDVNAEWEDLQRPARQDYHLRQNGGRFAYRELPDATQRQQLAPRAQYAEPRAAPPLNAPPRVVGALQPASP